MPQLRKTLVIVDMQPSLPASRPEWLIAAILKLIAAAKRDDMAIVILEYFSYEPLRFFGNTYDELVNAAKTVSHFAMRAKADCDGSERVQNALKALDVDSEHFIVCGINTHACVESTALGLTRLFPGSRIEVQAQACNDFRGNDWTRFAQAANLTVNHEIS